MKIWFTIDDLKKDLGKVRGEVEFTYLFNQKPRKEKYNFEIFKKLITDIRKKSDYERLKQTHIVRAFLNPYLIEKGFMSPEGKFVYKAVTSCGNWCILITIFDKEK